MTLPWRRARLARPAVATLVALSSAALGACSNPVEAPVGAAGALPAPTGTLVLALPGRPGDIDPLEASDSNEQLLVRQIYEPLVEKLTGPYGDLRSVPGPAVSVQPSRDDAVWHLRLRPGIVFQDGSRLDAAAVLANASRWRTTPAGRALLPGLVAADTPRPGLVRLFFDRPEPSVRRELALPQLGLVSPEALSTPTGTAATLARPAQAGTGPFEVRQRSLRAVVLARNEDWWGTARRLGPAVDSLQFDYVADADARGRLLRSGQAEIATGLPARVAALLGRDPLLSMRPGRGGEGATGLERSVRGVDFSGGTPALSGAWLTTIGAG